jgi:hypothetical protein
VDRSGVQAARVTTVEVVPLEVLLEVALEHRLLGTSDRANGGRPVIVPEALNVAVYGRAVSTA